MNLLLICRCVLFWQNVVSADITSDRASLDDNKEDEEEGAVGGAPEESDDGNWNYK